MLASDTSQKPTNKEGRNIPEGRGNDRDDKETSSVPAPSRYANTERCENKPPHKGSADVALGIDNAEGDASHGIKSSDAETTGGSG